ncbi:MAG: NUDIX domain-containing protein [Candidatus Paceibacterota bacterium]|jgi:ADP-ribose pyrophosphatase YjhB (NUDIX family)
MSNNKPLFTNKKSESNGQVYDCEYFDSVDFNQLPQDRIKQAYGVCFCDDKMIIGYGGLKKGWGLIGGSLEKEETYEQALVREIKEESNTEVLSFIPIGYQKITNIENGKIIYQLRFVCKVKPYGEFIIDGGDGMTEKGITEIKLIDPNNYKEYFDWGEIGDYIIKKAIKLKPQLN